MARGSLTRRRSPLRRAHADANATSFVISGRGAKAIKQGEFHMMAYHDLQQQFPFQNLQAGWLNPQLAQSYGLGNGLGQAAYGELFGQWRPAIRSAEHGCVGQLGSAFASCRRTTSATSYASLCRCCRSFWRRRSSNRKRHSAMAVMGRARPEFRPEFWTGPEVPDPAGCQ